MANLVLPLKGEYFDAIKCGAKAEEFRLQTPYWIKRLAKMQHGDTITLTLGYPPRGDTARRLTLPWRGMRHTTIVHPHFGDARVDVFAIDVRNAAPTGATQAAATRTKPPSK